MSLNNFHENLIEQRMYTFDCIMSKLNEQKEN